MRTLAMNLKREVPVAVAVEGSVALILLLGDTQIAARLRAHPGRQLLLCSRTAERLIFADAAGRIPDLIVESAAEPALRAAQRVNIMLADGDALTQVAENVHIRWPAQLV